MTEPQEAKIRVLVMDDEEALRKLMGVVLEESGFEPAFAKDGDEAVACHQRAHAEGRPFRAAILDLMVSEGQGGVAALKRMRALDPSLKAIVCSGTVYRDAMDEADDWKTAGFDACIPKPFDLDLFIETLNKVLDQPLKF